ncbi:DUF6600 domain-containing protein [Caulobacter sp. KR2-114]|uniref:DUF6600 domain-containing protein n=1 Tax=Caulobacter sp. KR2-114 TaxID=3400912 RepID=UPI003C072D38
MSHRRALLGLMTTCAAMSLAAAALADPPERVGRVRHVEGDVSFTPPGEQDWTDALRNYPVTSGEGYWTGDDGRVELQIGGLSARLDSLTELDVVDLDYGRTRLSLSQGSVDLRVWRAPRGGVAVQTPAGEIRIDQPGVYRIDVAAPPEDGSYPPVEFTVLEGSGVAPGGDGPMEIDAGQSALLYAGYDPQLQEADDAAIDDWARDREAKERWTERVDADDTGITGYDDLAAYGDFTDDTTYGQVWFPRDVPADWAPYRDGHWAYVQPWGWTWIDDQPWGFAPFHYGRWAQIGGRWGWVRGQANREPVYAPALVAFVGGSGWSVGLSVGGGAGGAVGWVPLAPDEVYRPSYRVSDSYVRQVNITNVRNTTVINNITLNAAAPSPARLRNATAATVVRADTFAHGGAVQHAAIAVPPQALASAPVASAAPIAAPDHAARLGGLKPIVGPGRPQGAAGGTAQAGAHAPSAPPPRLGAIRSALTQPTAPAATGPSRPPPIPGLHVAPQGAPPPHARGPALVAPSQIRSPQSQNQHPVKAGVGPGEAPGSNISGPQPSRQGAGPTGERRTPAPPGLEGGGPRERPNAAPPPTHGPGGAEQAAPPEAHRAPISPPPAAPPAQAVVRHPERAPQEPRVAPPSPQPPPPTEAPRRPAPALRTAPPPPPPPRAAPPRPPASGEAHDQKGRGEPAGKPGKPEKPEKPEKPGKEDKPPA